MKKLSQMIVILGFVLIMSSSVSAFQMKMPDLSESKKSPPVILITLESVRSHNVGPCYGYNRTTAPNICDIAEDGVLFENAYSQGTATTNAIPSLITGDLPVAVGRNDLEDPLIEGATPLTEILADNGYSTVGFLDPLERKLISSDLISDLDQTNGWTEYDRSEIPLFLEEDRKTFLWIFSRDTTHKPYWPESDYRKWDNLEPSYAPGKIIDTEEKLEDSSFTRQDLIDLYDEAILTEDAKIGRLMERLKERELYKESLIIVTGDHGESFGAHGNIGHGDDPVEEQIRVPLIIKLPENEYSGSRINSDVRHMDIVPTIQDYLNINREQEIEGKSLLPLLRGQKLQLKPVSASYPTSVYTVSDRQFKLQIENLQAECIDNRTSSKALFRLENHSSNRENIIKERQEVSERLTSTLCKKYSSGYERKIENLKATRKKPVLDKIFGLELISRNIYNGLGSIAEVFDIGFRNQTLEDMLSDEKPAGDSPRRGENREGLNSEESRLPPKPPQWGKSVSEPPYEVLESNFCQNAQLSFGSKLSPEFRVCLNEGGFRDKNYSVNKPDDVYRIIALGDAITFGVGVNGSQSWSSQLERQLNTGYEREFEVLNFGLPFKSTSEEVQWFQYINGTNYDSDLVVLQYMAGDSQNYSRVSEISERIKSNLPENISNQKKNRKAMRKAVLQEKRERESMPIEEEMENVVPYLETLDKMSEEHNFDVMVVYYSAGGTQISKRHIPYMREYTDKKNWHFMTSILNDTENNFTFHNSNPKASGHRIISSDVERELEKQFLIEERK